MPSVSFCLYKKIGPRFQLWKKEAKAVDLEKDSHV